MVYCQDGALGLKRFPSFLGPLVYFGNSTTATRLGCDPAQCSCFFNFLDAVKQVRPCCLATGILSDLSVCPDCSCSHAYERDLVSRLLAQDQAQSWLRPWSWRHSKQPGSCTLIPPAVWSTGPPRCECTVPAPDWLQREYPQPWRRVDKALFVEIPKGARCMALLEPRMHCCESGTAAVLIDLATWLCSGSDTLQH